MIPSRATTRGHSPEQVPDLTGVTAIAAGGTRSLALKSDGTVWTWEGIGYYGLLADGTTTKSYEPVQVGGGLKLF